MSTSAGDSLPVPTSMATLCRTTSGVNGLAAGHDRDQLGDHPLGQRDIGRFAREGDGVATHMQVGAQDAFQGAQILVCRTQ